MRFGIVIAAAAAALSLAACDSKSDQAAEVKADTIENAGEAQADAMEAQADKMEENRGRHAWRTKPRWTLRRTPWSRRRTRSRNAADAKADAVEQAGGKSE
jgi:hypothetical protein